MYSCGYNAFFTCSAVFACECVQLLVLQPPSKGGGGGNVQYLEVTCVTDATSGGESGVGLGG